MPVFGGGSATGPAVTVLLVVALVATIIGAIFSGWIGRRLAEKNARLQTPGEWNDTATIRWAFRIAMAVVEVMTPDSPLPLKEGGFVLTLLSVALLQGGRT
jgi:membrane protein YqaA with SNARE-associated domain